MAQIILRKLEVPNYPLLGPNVKALEFFGLILPRTLSKKFLYMFFHLTVVVFNATEYADVWFLRDDISSLLTNLKVTLLATVSVSKVSSFLIFQKDWIEVINYVTKADKEQRDKGRNKNVIASYTKYSRKITMFYFFLMYVTILTHIFLPIYKYAFSKTYRFNTRNGTESYVEVASSWVPFDKNTLIGHVLVVSYQSWSSLFGGGWITSFDTIAIVLMVFFKGELVMLKSDSAKIFGSEKLLLSREECKMNLMNCHQRHVELLKYTRLFDKCLSPVMFLYVIMCSIMICATAFQTNYETNPVQIFIAAIYFIFAVTQLFLYCWHSNEVYYASNDLSLGPYESVWWTRHISEQKNVNILCYQFEKSIAFSAGPFTNVTVATFISILKGAYSYYTLLNQTD